MRLFLLPPHLGSPYTIEERSFTTIEMHAPELEWRMRLRIQSGEFQDVDDLLTKALNALERDHPAVIR